MHVQPSWTKMYSSKEAFEVDFPGMKFGGPGLYLTETDTVLALMITSEGAHFIEADGMQMIWASFSKWPKDSAIEAFVWNCPVQDSILGKHIIVKQDDR